MQGTLALGEISECHIPDHIITLVYAFIWQLLNFQYNILHCVYSMDRPCPYKVI